jgi:hypothetical protein
MSKMTKGVIGAVAALVLVAGGYAARGLFHPAIVEFYTTPAGYGSKSCVAPALWISPTAFFSCQGGAWVQTLTP